MMGELEHARLEPMATPNEQVVPGRDQRVGVDLETEAVDHLRDGVEEALTVFVIEEEALSGDSAIRDVMPGPWIVFANLACHDYVG